MSDLVLNTETLETRDRLNKLSDSRVLTITVEGNQDEVWCFIGRVNKVEQELRGAKMQFAHRRGGEGQNREHYEIDVYAENPDDGRKFMAGLLGANLGRNEV